MEVYSWENHLRFEGWWQQFFEHFGWVSRSSMSGPVEGRWESHSLPHLFRCGFMVAQWDPLAYPSQRAFSEHRLPLNFWVHRFHYWSCYIWPHFQTNPISCGWSYILIYVCMILYVYTRLISSLNPIHWIPLRSHHYNSNICNWRCTGCRRIDLATRCKGSVFRHLFLLTFRSEMPKFRDNSERNWAVWDSKAHELFILTWPI